MHICSSLLELTSRIYPNFQPKKRMIAFQWVEGRLHYVTTQHFCLCNILNFNGGFRRHRLFSRFSALCPRTEQDLLSCRHHCHDTNGFFHLSWYWPFLIAIGEVAAERMCSMQPALDPWRGTCNTQCQLNPNLWHTLWPQINVFRYLSAFKYNFKVLLIHLSISIKYYLCFTPLPLFGGQLFMLQILHTNLMSS